VPQNIFKIYDGRTNFWQWDKNQKLIVLDENITEVRFSNKNMTHSIPENVYTDRDGLRVCNVPDVLLTIPKNLLAYVCDDEVVVKTVKFAVVPQPIPSDYISDSNGDFDEIVERIYIDIGVNTDAIKVLNGNESTEGSVAKSIKDSIDSLRLADTYAAKAHGHYIHEVDGLTDAITNAVAIEKKRSEGVEDDLRSDIDAINNADTGILKQAKDYADGLKVVVPDAAEYSIVKAVDSGDYAAVYNLTKDGAIVGAPINIPKDMVIKSGSVIGDEIVLVLNDEAATEIRVSVASLIECVTSGSNVGDMVFVNVSDDNKVTATITDGTVTLEKLTTEVQTAIGNAHTHENATVLDGINADDVENWNGAQTAAEGHANALNTAMDTRVKALEKIDHDAYVDADATLKAELQAEIDAAVANSKPDWVVNDENAADYIKNRTHYTEEVVKDIEYEININGEHNIPLELGQTYELWYTTTYNNEWVALTDSSTNEIITCEVKEDDNGLYVGDPNHSIWPTCARTTNSTVMSQFISAYSIVSMKIATHTTTTVVHQIDQKFVPNADWNVNDENANGYIKNRPFGDIFTEKEYIFERGDVTTASGTHAYELSCAGFDGNKLAVGEGYSVYYTTSFTSNPIVWAKLSPADGEKFIAKVDENGVIYIGDPAVNSDIFYISSQTCAVNYMWVNQFTYAKGVKLVGPFVDIKQIAPKYINDMYYDETVAESLLDNHTITGFAPNGNMYTVNTNTLFDIVEGDVYQVTWDGVEYEAVGSLFEGILYVGEINAMLTGMLGDEYPFCFALFIDQFAVATSNTGESHTLSVKKLGVETHTIPEKYIPHTIVSDWNIDDSTAFGYIKNKPFYDTATYTLVSDNELNELLSDVTSTQNSENVFRVVINGVTYDNVPGTYGYMTAGYIGVGDKPSSSGWNTTDFGFYYSRQRDNANADWGLVVNPDILPDVDSSTAVVEVYLQHRKLKKLDPKYLPDDLVTVEYVDSKVVQSDWNQNDTTNTSYIKNRPFYAEREVVFENLNVAGNLLTPYVFDSALSLEDGAMYYASGVYSSSITNTPGDVSFDGTYKCVDGIITIFPYENSGEPVLSVLSDKIQIGVGNKQGNASVIFASLEKIVGYHTLDEKFIPDTIARVSEVEEVKNLIGDTSVSDQINTAIAAIKPKCTAITLPASNWTGDANPWSQVVTVNGVTSNSKVDLQPTAVQIVDLQNNEITLILQNDNGVVTAWAIGNKPTKDYTMQVLITEVVRV
jgi:hypothetical protein